ncbi:MAG: hypothetical protein HKN32_08370, partial [Flavobacteriales bacterium]|nr:hypothetical protein [Flavobacteriales bacterium]
MTALTTVAFIFGVLSESQDFGNADQSNWRNFLFDPAFPILAACFSAIGLVLLQDRKQRLVWVAGSLALGYLLPFLSVRLTIVVLFVPTLIHVYLFTLAFMVQGSMKKKSLLSWVSVVMLIVAPILLILAPQIDGEFLFDQTKDFLNISGFNNMQA